MPDLARGNWIVVPIKESPESIRIRIMNTNQYLHNQPVETKDIVVWTQSSPMIDPDDPEINKTALELKQQYTSKDVIAFAFQKYIRENIKHKIYPGHV